MPCIGIDLGGTKTEIILTSSKNVLDVQQRRRVPTQQERGYDFIVSQLVSLIQDYQALCDEPPTIGIGIPGSLSPSTGLVRAANTQCLIGHSLKDDLEAEVGHPVQIANDANCFALSEATLGAGKGHAMVLGVIMGTGMGGGIVIHGTLWNGLTGNAGEWGHSSIHQEGPLCWCGQRGCLELYLSGTGIETQYHEVTGVKKALPEIYQDFQAKEPKAQEVLQQTLVYFGRAMANLITTLDPSIIVLGGGVSNLPILYKEGLTQVAQQLFTDHFSTPIVPNELGDSSGVYGAALLGMASS